MLTRACLNPKTIKQRIQKSRDSFEKPRQRIVSNMRGDLSKVAKQEFDFAKSFLKTIVPVSITIDQDAKANGKGLRKIIPVTISFIEDDTEADAKRDYVAVEPVLDDDFP